MRIVVALVAFCILAIDVAAQPVAPVPSVDPAQAITGQSLVDALRGGGYVLYLRHAKQGKFTEACTESNLSPEGEAQARQVGAALRHLRIPVGSVRASTLCRASDTARALDVGPVEITSALNPTTPADKEIHAARLALLAEVPRAGTNTILVSHFQNSANQGERIVADFVEAIVYRPDGKGGAAVVARVRRDDWAALGR